MALGADINREVRQVGAVVKLLARRVVAEPDGRVPRTADARADSIEIIVPYPSLGSASAAHIYTCGKRAREREGVCVCVGRWCSMETHLGPGAAEQGPGNPFR